MHNKANQHGPQTPLRGICVRLFASLNTAACAAVFNDVAAYPPPLFSPHKRGLTRRLQLTNPRAKMQHLIKRVGADPQRRYVVRNYE